MQVNPQSTYVFSESALVKFNSYIHHRKPLIKTNTKKLNELKKKQQQLNKQKFKTKETSATFISS